MMTLTTDQLVELQDHYSNVYARSPTGARGWVRDHRRILNGDAEVFIEWDKDHWRYHGESDMWAFAHHFRPVDDLFLAAVSPPHSPTTQPDRSYVQEQFLQTLLDAQEAALDAEAYFIITLTPRTESDSVVYEPQIFTGMLDRLAGSLIEAQLIQTAAQLYGLSVLRTVQETEDDLR